MSSELIDIYNYLEELEGPSALCDFISVWRKNYEPPYHLQPVADIFWRIEHGDTVYATVSVPPRHSKTETLLTLAARYLLKFPHKRVGYVTYAASLAESKSRICRDVALTLGVKLRQDSKSVTEWLTREGGGFICCGIGGALTGRGCDILIVDDPHSNREEAESVVMKDKVEDWFTSVALTRLEPGASVIVNATRWASDDLIGRIIDKEDPVWEHINLPAIDIRGKALWPTRWSVDALLAKQRLIGEYDFASLYQGSPMPRGKMLFHDPIPDNYYSFPSMEGARLVIGVDPAASSKNHADYSVICVASSYGKEENQITEILDMWYGQIEIPELVDKIHQYSKDWGAKVIVESVGGFKGVAQMLRRIDRTIPVIETTPTTDKYTRAIPLIAAWNDGRVRLPQNAAWTKKLLKEVKAFTATGSNTTDDMIDAMNIAWSALNIPEGIRKGPRSLRTK